MGRLTRREQQIGKAMRDYDAAHITLTLDEWQLAKLTADRRTKERFGHYFVMRPLMQPTKLDSWEAKQGERCKWCQVSRSCTRQCSRWYQTFMAHLDQILSNLDVERREWQKDGGQRMREMMTEPGWLSHHG